MRQPVGALIGQLDSLLPWRRRAAAEALGRAGDPLAVEPLMHRLGDRNRSVRCAVVLALGALGDARAVAGLARLLTDIRPPVRQAAALALIGLPDVREAVRQLELRAAEEGSESAPHPPSTHPGGPLLAGATRAHRRAAMAAFESAWALVDNRVSSQGTAPGKAIEVVGEVGGERAIPSLVSMLARPDSHRYPDAVEYAKAALGDLAPGREAALARAALSHVGIDINHFGRLLVGDPAYHLRCPVVRELLLKRGEAGIAGLLRAVDVRDTRQRRATASALLAFDAELLAGAALEELRGADSVAIMALRAVCDEEPLLWRRIVNRWRALRPAQAPSDLLASPYPWARLWAAEALGGAPYRSMHRPLRGPLGSTEEGDRLAGAVGLSWQGEPGALEPLVKALGAPERETRVAAALGLGRMGARAAAALPRLEVLLDMEPHPEGRIRYREAIERIKKALEGAPAELEASSAPAGVGYELEAASAPAGTGTEPISDDAGPTAASD